MFKFWRKDKEVIFWDWFVKNKAKIEAFMESDFSDYTIYHRLTRKMQTYHSVLIPELTKTESDQYVLIISPDGDKNGLGPTRTLFDHHPPIDNWVIKKFRQPVDHTYFEIEGVGFPVEHLEVLPDFHDEVVDIQLFVKNLNQDEQRYRTLAILYLDHILGEFNSITKLGYVDVMNLDEGKTVESSINLVTLRKMIEDQLY